MCSSIDTIEIAANHDFSLVKKRGKWEQIKNSTQKNIAKLKQTEKALEKLRYSEDQFRSVVQNAKSGIALVDESGKFAVVNPSFMQMFGLNNELDILNVNSQDWSQWEVYGEDGKLLHVDDHPVRKVVMTSKPVKDQLVAVRNPGANELTWMMVSAEPVMKEDGHIYRVICTYHDITEQKKAKEALLEAHEELQIQSEKLAASYEELQVQSEELQAQSDELHEAYEALSESEKRYRLLFDHSLDAIILTDPRDAGKILSVNPAACGMLGWSEDELIGKGRDVLFDQTDPALSALLEERAHFGSAKVQLTYRRKDRTTFIGELSTTFFTDINGESRAVTIIRDITKRKQAEETLRKSEERYKMLFRNMTEAFLLGEVICDKDGEPYDYICLDANPAYEVNSGVKKEIIIGKSVRELFPDANLMSIKRYGEVALSGQPTNFEFFSQALNRYLDVNVFSPEKGKFAVIFSDITERKKAEEDITQQARLLNLSYDAILIRDYMDRITYWNLGAQEIYGYTEEEALGCIPHELLKTEFSKPLEEVYETLYRDGRWVGELIHTRKNGQKITVATRWILDQDARGNLISILETNSDITERKNAEAKLRYTLENLESLVKKRTEELEKAYHSLKESEEKYRNIIETTNEGILVIDSELKITYVNKHMTEMLGYSQEEIMGKSLSNFFDEEGKVIIQQNMKKRRRGIDEVHELRLIRKDGSPFWVLVSSKALQDENGKFEGSLSMLTDITEHKESEDFLAKIEIARQKEIHHRIKNNLQVISSLLDLQAEKFKDIRCIESSEIFEAFKESQDRVMSIALIHQELHESKRTDELNFSLYLQRLADNLFQTYRLETVNVSLNLDIEENIFFDMDTAVPLGMIVNEIISNSFKYAFLGRNKGKIQIKVYRKEDTKDENTEYVLFISDNGIGIPKNIDFGNPETLGLQLVNILVEQIDGSVKLKRGQGTEFLIMFNVVERRVLPVSQSIF